MDWVCIQSLTIWYPEDLVKCFFKTFESFQGFVMKKQVFWGIVEGRGKNYFLMGLKHCEIISFLSPSAKPATGGQA